MSDEPEMSIESLIRRPVAVSMAYVALLAGGIFALWRLPLDLAPNVEYPGALHPDRMAGGVR